MFTKGQRVYRACVLEFEGALTPVVVPGIVATVNPQRDGTKSYHVRELDLLERGCNSATSFSRVEQELFADAVEAMTAAVIHMANVSAMGADVSHG
jgi:hypothetical protein